MGGKRAPDVTRKYGSGRLRERRDPARKVDFGGSRVTFACQGGRVFGRASKVEREEVKASRSVCSLRLLWFVLRLNALLSLHNARSNGSFTCFC